VKSLATKVWDEVQGIVYQEYYKIITSMNNSMVMQMPPTHQEMPNVVPPPPELPLEYAPLLTTATTSTPNVMQYNNEPPTPMPSNNNMPRPPDPPPKQDLSPLDDSISRDALDEEEYTKLVHRKRRARVPMKKARIRGQERRMCEWCNSSDTPEWRKGPKSEVLCNACGLQYKKRLKKKLQNTKT